MRYEFTPHPEKSGWYLVTDTKWMFSCEFKEHEFNETQIFFGLDRLGDSPEKATEAMNELGDWLFSHHYYETMPLSAYEVRLSEDDTEIHIIRRKLPEMDAKFLTDDLEAIARALAKASEFMTRELLNQMTKKVYIFRITNHNGKKEFKRTKCSNYWTTCKSVCWQFSPQGAKVILETLNKFNRTNYYTYGIESV